ncbi:zf-C3HC-domain-containing protein [Thelephora ganbajun]|uniref:Zf-C3HC-domain-containing protein n=1 Tax=Thelephora ganbajun TaxID=370292 RepID=A0ACB6ZGR2_THEGA|nr:zf-C3HC-domain-containing protein [Thelephora ganbajun]
MSFDPFSSGTVTCIHLPPGRSSVTPTWGQSHRLPLSTMTSSLTTPSISNVLGTTHGTKDAAQTASNAQTMKRKLDDALQTLDDAVFVPSETLEHPPPPKRSRSIYSTLAKYGITSKESKPPAPSRLESLTKSAPHLAAILSRGTLKSRTPNPASRATATPLSVTPPSTSEYRPSSTASFLSRLSTYRLATYANKPSQIDAVAAAKCGWVNDGRDRLVCGVCKNSWVVASTQGMKIEAAGALVEKQKGQLVSMHKDGCPWKTQQCDDSVYRLPVQSPATTAKEIKYRALDLQPVLEEVQVKHPLSATQVHSLMSALSTFNVRPGAVTTSLESEGGSPGPSSASDAGHENAHDQVEPSETAALTALFGWTLPRPTEDKAATRRTSVVSSLSRASSVVSFRNEKSMTTQSAPSISRRGSPSPASIPTQIPSVSVPATHTSQQKRDASLLYCKMCQRRIGLWAFGPQAVEKENRPQRQFDLLKEHRPYCPYVVRSTIVPSFPVPSGHSAITNSAHGNGNVSVGGNLQDVPIEGWRAMLSIALKARKRPSYGTGRSVSTVGPVAAEGANGNAESFVNVDEMEVDRVEAMVERVKKRGGRDVLKYVRGLLG